MFDKLTGERVDISTQTPNSNVQGYEFGYDAFRTIWYVAFDYSMFRDSRAKNFLQTILPFFQGELVSKDYFYPVYRINGTPTYDYESGSGFPSVYLNLFDLLSDTANERKVLNRLWQLKQSSTDGRVWFSSLQNPSEGENEYFMNFWALFGLYLYQHNNLGDVDNNQAVVLRDVISILRVLSGINTPIVCFDINGDVKIGIEELIYLLQTVVHTENRVIAYYSLAAGSVNHDTATSLIRKGLSNNPIPVMILARLAVDLEFQGRKIGKFLLRDAILRVVNASETFGIRAVLVHAKDEKARLFYEKFDFESSLYEN